MSVASLSGLFHDLRVGSATLARAPGFSFVVIATLALVIGANATVFSVMHGVLWRPLPYPDPDRLVILDADYGGAPSAGISAAEAVDLRAEPNLFDGVATIVGNEAHVTIDGEMAHFVAASASDDALPLLGTPLALGRPLEASRDTGPNLTMRSVVVSHRLWRQQLGGDPYAIGRRIEVNNIDVEVVGVLAEDFRLLLPAKAGIPELVDVWFPRPFDDNRRDRGQASIARLAPGVSLDDTRARLGLLAQRFAADYPAMYDRGGLRLHAAPLHDLLTANVTRSLWVLAGAIAAVLLIGCVNIANLMLARIRARSREFAIRQALGAGRARLAQQLLGEAAVLAAIGAACGFALAFAGVRLLGWLNPSLPRGSTVTVTTEAAMFVAGIAVLATLALGLLPMRAGCADAPAPLHAGRGASARPRLRRLQRFMVVAEVALSIVPLVAAGLMLRTFVNLSSAPLGFDTDGIISARIAFSFADFPRTADRVRLLESSLERVRALPGVTGAAAGGPVPFSGWEQTRAYGRSGEPELTSRGVFQSVLPGYIPLLGTRLLAGRDFTDDDIHGERPVVIVERRIAEQLWPDGALGKHLSLGPGMRELEVIGVSEPVRVTSVRDDALPHVFVPYHVWAFQPSLVVRSSMSAAALAPALKDAVESLGTRRPVFDIAPLRSYVDRSIGDARFMALVLGGFALAAVLLTAIGLYGTLAYLASFRTAEFGVRMALGATAAQVLRTVAGEGLLLTAVGTGIGLAGAIAAARALEALLYGVTPADTATMVTTGAAMAVIAVAASLQPAWRAARSDPSAALRAD